jgi:hypothetical protein
MGMKSSGFHAAFKTAENTVKKVAQKVFNTIFRKFPHLQQV